jgi:hypothetical protein
VVVVLAVVSVLVSGVKDQSRGEIPNSSSRRRLRMARGLPQSKCDGRCSAVQCSAVSGKSARPRAAGAFQVAGRYAFPFLFSLFSFPFSLSPSVPRLQYDVHLSTRPLPKRHLEA